MPELTLVPVAAKLRLRPLKDDLPVDWPNAVRGLVAAIAQEVARTPGVVIGHIKGVVRSPGHLLRVNCVSASLPVEVEGDVAENAVTENQLAEMPKPEKGAKAEKAEDAENKDRRELTLELVLLVYGLTSAAAYQAIAAAAQAGAVHGCVALWQPPSDAARSPAHSHGLHPL